MAVERQALCCTEQPAAFWSLVKYGIHFEKVKKKAAEKQVLCSTEQPAASWSPDKYGIQIQIDPSTSSQDRGTPMCSAMYFFVESMPKHLKEPAQANQTPPRVVHYYPLKCPILYSERIHATYPASVGADQAD
eukprot:573482-Pelagomonas_calceolata.AAC.1